MRRAIMIAMAVLSLSTLVLAACAGGTTPVEVKAPQVALSEVYAVFGGKESTTIQADFTIKNPSNVEVKLDSFEFTLACEDKNVGYVQNPNDYYIPAGGEIAVSGVTVVPFSNMVAELLMGKGMTSGDATKAVLPYWKKMGGVLPADALKPVWDEVPAGVTWNVSGTAYVMGDGQKQDARFTLSLKR
ncbi:MAG: hypothetical protein AB1603_00500 [Chloroflexota bacterium]